MKKLVIAIDFDGTIVEHKFPLIGEIKPYVKEVMNRLFDKGHELIIWTCRAEKEHLSDMKNFIYLAGIKYTKINENSDKVVFGCWPKIYADVYIDDRGVFWKYYEYYYGEKIWLIIENYINSISKGN